MTIPQFCLVAVGADISVTISLDRPTGPAMVLITASAFAPPMTVLFALHHHKVARPVGRTTCPNSVFHTSAGSTEP